MLFSIITVTYNNLGGLRQTCESLTRQAFRDFEWIVIDGGSADGTVSFLKQTSACWHSAPDNGIYDAMNKGIGRARGDYLLFLNAGDTLAAPDTLRMLAARIAQNDPPPDFIYADALEDHYYKTARPHTRIMRGLFTHHQAMLYRRSLIGELRYDTAYKIAADYKFTAQFLQKAATIDYMPLALCHFETGGISQQCPATGRREQYAIRRALGDISRRANLMIYMRQMLANTLRKTLPSLYWRLRP